MAPELLQGQPPSVQSDIYAVGVLLFYLSTGSYPPGPNTPARPVAAIPPPLFSVIQKAIARDAAERWVSATRMGEALTTARPISRPLSPLHASPAPQNGCGPVECSPCC